MLKQLYLVCAINQILAGDQNIGSYLSKERIISQFGYEGTEGQNVDITRQMLSNAQVTKITRVEVIDLRPDKNGGSAYFAAGGLGFPSGRLKLIPLPYQVMSFKVSIYGIDVPL